MLDWKILTNLKIYLNPNLYLGGQRTINNTFCTVCIERRYVVYCYTIFLISDQNHYCNIIWFELYPYCFVSHSIWYCCKHPNELCTPAYSSVTLVLGFSASTLKNPFLHIWFFRKWLKTVSVAYFTPYLSIYFQKCQRFVNKSIRKEKNEKTNF